MSVRGRLVGDAKVKNGVLHIVAPQRGYLLKPQELQGEMSSSEKAKRVAQKKRLGQPAGKPRRVEAVRRKKRGTKKGSMKGYTIKSGDKRPTKKGAGMTAKGVARYRRENPGSKLQTAVTGKVKKGSKAAKRRKSYCARSLGQLKRSSAKTRNDPNSRIRQARRRWKC